MRFLLTARINSGTNHRHFYVAMILGVALALCSLQPAASAPASDGVLLYPGVSLQFDHLTFENGLSQNDIHAILQDRQGFIWIGTQDGLNRYDGYTFQQFKNDPQDPNSIGYNNISALFQDNQGFLWVGTAGGGLDRYDLHSGIFTHFRHDPAKPDSLIDPFITSIVQVVNDQLWVGTLGGLELLDTSTGRFTHYIGVTSDLYSLSSNVISVITPSADGKLWVGTGANGSPGAGLNRFDPATGQVERFDKSGLCLDSQNISSILVDKLGSLWIGHGGNGLPGGGLDHFDPVSHSCRHYDSLSTRGQFVNDNIIGLLLDQQERLWISFWGGGLAYMEPGEIGVFSNVRHDSTDPVSLSSDNASALFQDQTGVLWIGTSDAGINLLNLGGLQFRVYRHDPANPAGLASNTISAFAETPDGSIWIGTQEAGLALFHPEMGQFTYFRNIPSNPNSLSSNRIMSLYADQDGTLWVGTVNAGLNHFDPKTGMVERYRHDSSDSTSLIDDEITSIIRDGAGSLWVATMGGLSRLDPDQQGFVNYSGLIGAPVALALDGGDLWIGTWGGGVSRLRLALPGILPPDRTRLSILDTYLHDTTNPDSLSENDVWAIYRSADRMLWFGTSDGLNRYNPETGEFTLYNENNGLRNASIACITEDSKGFLWITTANGLVRFDPSNETSLIYDKSDGLQGSDFNRNACLYSQNSGDIYTGGTEGFSVFNPLEITRNIIPPTVVITGFKVFDKPIPLYSLNQAPIKLSYTQNYISLEFTALDFHASSANTYAYMLDGFDKSWIQSGSVHQASYAGLPAGNYTFRVKAANSDGTWSVTDAILPIDIIPPLWQRWQFQVGTGIALALLVLAGFQWRLMASRANARSLEMRIAERSEQLNKANEQLREKATQDAVAAERTRLARDLHDAVTQTLFSASLIAEVLPEIWQKNRKEGKRRLEELRLLTRGALAEMRTMLVELRPNALIEIPLPTLLRQLTDALIGRARLDIQFHSSGEKKLPPDVQVGLYRIAQESLNNVIKHSHATQAIVSLQSEETLQMTISDNGTGFDTASVTPDHIGIKIMRERAETIGAIFEIISQPGKGTHIVVTWQGNTGSTYPTD